MTRNRPAVILGGGIAGLLCATVLLRNGIQPLLIERPIYRRPQLAHVHFFDSWTYEGLEQLLPGLQQVLVQSGVPQGNEGNYSFGIAEAEEARPLPTILQLDGAVRKIVLAECGIQQRKLLRLGFENNRWELQFDSCQSIESPLLIDATGRARVSFNAVSHFTGQPLPLNTGPKTSVYVSQVLRNVNLRCGQLGFRVRDKSGLGALLCRESGESRESREGRGLWRLTLQLPAGVRVPDKSEEVMRLVLRLSESRAASAILDAIPVGKPIPFGAQAAERVATDEAPNLPDGWLAVGDALLSTAPYLGWGLAQIVEQMLALAEGLEQDLSIPDLRNKLNKLAYQRWVQAMTRDALVSLAG